MMRAGKRVCVAFHHVPPCRVTSIYSLTLGGTIYMRTYIGIVGPTRHLRSTNVAIRKREIDRHI